MLRGAIFDLNGTMIFDGPCQEQAWRTWARAHLGLELSDEDFAYRLHGVNLEGCLEYMLGRKPTQAEIDAAEPEREQHYRDLCSADTEGYHLAEGLPKLLDTLVERGVKVNIASSSPRANMEFHFEHLGLDRWFSFDSIAYNNRTFPGKPEPDIFLIAAQRIGVPTSSCAVFEDAPSGIEAARRAGAARIIAVASEYSADFLSSFPGVDAVISDYLDADGMLSSEFSTTIA